MNDERGRAASRRKKRERETCSIEQTGGRRKGIASGAGGRVDRPTDGFLEYFAQSVQIDESSWNNQKSCDGVFYSRESYLRHT